MRHAGRAAEPRPPRHAAKRGGCLRRIGIAAVNRPLPRPGLSRRPSREKPGCRRRHVVDGGIGYARLEWNRAVFVLDALFKKERIDARVRHGERPLPDLELNRLRRVVGERRRKLVESVCETRANLSVHPRLVLRFARLEGQGARGCGRHAVRRYRDISATEEFDARGDEVVRVAPHGHIRPRQAIGVRRRVFPREFRQTRHDCHWNAD